MGQIPLFPLLLFFLEDCHGGSLRKALTKTEQTREVSDKVLKDRAPVFATFRSLPSLGIIILLCQLGTTLILSILKIFSFVKTD